LQDKRKNNYAKTSYSDRIFLVICCIAAESLGTGFRRVLHLWRKSDRHWQLVSSNRRQLPPSPPYFNGRFSNSPIWLETLDDRVEIDGYTEKGAGSLNMKVEDQEAESVVLSLGTQAAYAFNSGIGIVIPHVRASYEHEFADDSRKLITELVIQPSIPIRTTTDTPDRDYVKLGAGTQVLFLDNLSGAIDYEAVIGREDVNYQVIKGKIRS